MKNKLLLSFCILVMIWTAAGCGTDEENLAAPIAVEPIEESSQGDEEDLAGEQADLKETADTSGEETQKEDSLKKEEKSPKEVETQNAESEGKEKDTSQTDPEKAAYDTVLKNLYKTYALPDGTELGYNEIQALSENKFAIYDIDQDGKEELIISWTTTYTVGMVQIIYGFDSAAGAVKTELLEFPAQTFYENGVVRVELSHNHGLAGSMDDFWPHTFYRYDKNSDTYLVIAEVDAWNKAYYELDYDGSPFPEELDVDGDGILYRITADGKEKLIDLEEYRKWQDSILGESKTVEIPFVEMTEESIQVNE